ncbi:hypothetical protein MRX96_018989 [Rhipicephalus microplus]
MCGDIHKLSDREKLIIDQCIMKANMKSTKAARYKKEWLYDCLLLKIKSTAVYTFLHENSFLLLPHPRTLYSYLKNLKAGFGFDENLFAILKDKVGNIPERERRAFLMFDEMSVRRSLHVRESDMTLLGKVIIDPPHIFKCIRNNLLKAGKFLLPGDKEVQHFHFEAMLDYEEQQAGLRAVPKLMKAHIRPNAFQKLSVKLAVQLFTESTTSAMDFYRSREECVKLRGSKATSDFATRTNILFDCLNSKRPQDVQYN